MKRHHLEKNHQLYQHQFLNEPAPKIFLKQQDLPLHGDQDDQLTIFILIANVSRQRGLDKTWNKHSEFLCRRHLLPDLPAHRRSLLP